MIQNIIFKIRQIKWLIYLLLFLSNFNALDAQVSDFCNSLPPHQATSQNPDSMYYDRFENTYDYDIDTSQTQHLEICQNGFFILTYIGNNITIHMQEVIGRVFEDLSDIITRRNNLNSCGDPLPQECVSIEIREDNSLPCIAASAFYELNQSRNSCDHLTINCVYQKLNGGYANTPVMNGRRFDGLVCINTNINWNIIYDNDPMHPLPNEKDLRSAMLHEALHLLGIVSLFNATGGTRVSNYYEIFDKYIHVVENSNSIPPPIQILSNNSNCIENCWGLNSSVFQNPNDFSNIVRDNCLPNADYNIVFGNQSIAPILGGSGISPSDLPQSTNFIGEMMSHLHPNCQLIPANVKYCIRKLDKKSLTSGYWW